MFNKQFRKIDYDVDLSHIVLKFPSFVNMGKDGKIGYIPSAKMIRTFYRSLAKQVLRLVYEVSKQTLHLAR